MNVLFFQYHNRPSETVSCSRDSISAYARYLGAEYRFLTGPVPFGNPFFGAFLPFFTKGSAPCAGFAVDFDVVAFFDSDIIWTGKPESLLEAAYIDDGKIAMHHMNCGPVVSEALKAEVSEACKGTAWEKIGHCNSGVIVWPYAIYREFSEFLHSEIRKPEPNTGFGGNDQYYLNRFGLKKGTTLLPYRFNYHLGRYPIELANDQVLVHYHGNRKSMLVNQASRFGSV